MWDLLPDVTTLLGDARAWAVAAVIGGVGYWFKAWLPHLRKRVSDRHQKRINNAKALADQGSRNEALADFLERYYGVTCWKPDTLEVRYPALVLAVDNPQHQSEFNCVLSPWDSLAARAQEGPFVCYDKKFISDRLWEMQRSGGEIKNRMTYVLQHVEVQKDQPPKVHSALLGRYLDCLATCDALEFELLVAFAKHSPRPVEFSSFAWHRLPHRTKLTEYAADNNFDSVLCGRGRSAAIAVSTLTVCRREGEYIAIFGPRSGRTAAHPHLLHVAPSGMFQPSKDWPSRHDDHHKTEWDLRNHVFRELLDELFSYDTDNIEGDTPERFHGFSDALDLEARLNKGTARLYVTAVLVNLLNLRPEICTLLVIDDPSWFALHNRSENALRGFKKNWEFADDDENRERQRKEGAGKILWFQPVTDGGRFMEDRELAQRYLSQDLGASTFVVPGAVALWRGLDVLRKRQQKGA